MPFFGSKKEKKPAPPAGAAYPKQSPYPTQPSAPPMGAEGQHPPPYSSSAAPPQYGQPPPPQYTPAQQQYQGYPGQQPAYYPMQPQYGGPPQGMAYGAYGGYSGMPHIPQGAHVVGNGQFDAGARFTGGASMNVPPPPPGMMPNAAQIAAAHGGTVHMSQAKGGIFSGGSDGGVSTHFD